MIIELEPEEYFALKALMAALEIAENEKVTHVDLRVTPYGRVHWQQDGNVYITLEPQDPDPERKLEEALRKAAEPIEEDL